MNGSQNNREPSIQREVNDMEISYFSIPKMGIQKVKKFSSKYLRDSMIAIVKYGFYSYPIDGMVPNRKTLYTSTHNTD